MAEPSSAYPAEFLMRNQPPLDRLNTTGRCRGLCAVVTGGASGIGRAVVERFLNDGAERVAIFDIDARLGRFAVKDLLNEGVAAERVKFYRVDVSDEAQVQKATEEFATGHCGGRIHAFIGCAARFTSLSTTAVDADYIDSYRVNVLGVVHCVRALRPFLRAAGASGVVLLSSSAAFVAQKQRWTYAATKGATSMLVKNMAMDLAEDGVRVNGLVPGYVWSPVEKAVSADGSREAMSFLTRPASLLGRDSLVAEMAAVIVFLCCADASAVTGTLMRADCGYLSMGPDGRGDGRQPCPG